MADLLAQASAKVGVSPDDPVDEKEFPITALAIGGGVLLVLLVLVLLLRRRKAPVPANTIPAENTDRIPSYNTVGGAQASPQESAPAQEAVLQEPDPQEPEPTHKTGTFCTECGQRNVEGTKFCGACGTRLK